MRNWTRDPLNRRTFLSGAGAVTISLPFLEALRAPVAHAAAKMRFVGFFVPNGKHMPAWKPAKDGAGFELSPSLAALTKVRSKVSVVTGLANNGATRRIGGDHARGTGAFLTCTNIKTSEEISSGQNPNGISLDQVLADELGSTSRVRSLQLGLSNDGGDQGYPSEFIQNVSFDKSGRHIPKTIRPDAAFDRLFAGADLSASSAEAQRRKAYDTSVLDYVKDQATSLRSKVSQSDTIRLDQYFTSVRELEQRIAVSPALNSSCSGAQKPVDFSATPARIRAMLDVIVLALSCDATRIVTFMMGNGGDGAIGGFPWLSVPDHHHGIAHHQRNESNYNKIKIVDKWEVEQLAYLLEKLDAISDPSGTLLDQCIVFYSSEISDGDRHNHNDLPVLLAGGSAGGIGQGKHVNYTGSGGRPIADLFISILKAMGSKQTSFADGKGPLQELVT